MSNNNEEEPVIGSRLKMKIKFTSSNPSSSAATSSPINGQDHLVKNENHTDYPNCRIVVPEPIPAPTQTPSPTNDSPSSMHLGFSCNKKKFDLGHDPETSPTTDTSSSMGKRKKKPRQMPDEFICHSPKRVRKSFFKSDYVESSRGAKSSRKRKLLTNGLHPDEEPTPTMIRAEEVQATLSSEFPSFTKVMVKSHVVNGFWMGVPGYFSREHLPRMDATLLLVDESGKEFQLKYIADKMGLSAGWRKFTVEQKLLEDDVLIFQLVEPCKFKVYVVRANDFNEVDGALSLLNLEAQIEHSDAERVREEERPKSLCVSTYKRRRKKSLHSSPLNLKNKKTKPGKSVPRTLQLGYKTTDPNPYCSLNFENLENFEDFTIMIDGLCVDSVLPEDIRIKYYDLCASRNDFIHANLVDGLNPKLIAGIICETVTISDSIRACSLMTTQDEFENWDKTLKSFELLGMKVGFLRNRVNRLVGLAFESDGVLETRKYMEAKKGMVQAEEEIVNLETKIIELKEASEKYNADIEAFKYKAQSYELKFQEEVDAPW